MSEPAVKTILGYDIVEGVSVEEYERWLWDIHYPDMLANPYLERIVVGTVVHPVTTTSAGTPTTDEVQTFYRVVEMHYENHQAYENYLRWFEEHPIPPERGPAGRTEFRFYVLCDIEVAERPTAD